jgi:hypothetical protein
LALAFGTAVVIATAAVAATATTASGATGIEAVAWGGIPGSIAAVFPAPGTGCPVATTTTAVATAIVAPVVATATPITTTCIAAATAIAAATLTTATTTGSPGLGFVDAQGPSHQLGTLKGINGFRFSGVIRHLDKCEAALSPGIPLKGQRTVDHFTEGCKQFSHVFLLSAEGKVANKDAHEPEIDRGADTCGPLGR